MTSLGSFIIDTSHIDYRPHGVFYSEAFIFLLACARLRATVIVESGVRHGMSTALLSATWPGELVSIDRSLVEPETSALDRVDRGARPVKFLKGDAFELLPKCLRYAADLGRLVGVLIDGPKGMAALRLKDVCMALPSCALVGVHDVAVGAGDATSYTQEARFAPLRDALDGRVPEKVRAKHPLGPGLAIWEKAKKEDS